MDEAKRHLVETWLTKAEHDLAAARKLGAGVEPVLDVAIYHCQQAAEKAVKAFLAFCDEPPLRTHDIRVLVGRAAARDSRFSQWEEAAEQLTPYATMYRYPGEPFEPEPEEFAEAQEAAAGVLAFTRSLLPASL
jgi:HEPN domain-containing protein